jgi:hypothetical protein
MEPTDCVQRDGPGVADDNDALQIPIDTTERVTPPIGAHTIFDCKVAALDGDAEAVARENEDTVPRTQLA